MGACNSKKNEKKKVEINQREEPIKAKALPNSANRAVEAQSKTEEKTKYLITIKEDSTLLLEEEFGRVSNKLVITTDDGSYKIHGFAINELKKEFAYMEFVYGVKMRNRKLARMNSDEWEIYKARKYVTNENRKGHECYNAVEGKKLWINREAWRMRHER